MVIWLWRVAIVFSIAGGLTFRGLAFWVAFVCACVATLVCPRGTFPFEKRKE